MERHRLAIVVPALNEAQTIAKVVENAERFGTPIVVDDGSTDDTAGIAASARALVVSLSKNEGYDQALNAGFRRACDLNFEFVLTMDADGQHDPACIDAMVTDLEGGADVVLGVRDHQQRIMELVFACVTRWRWGIRDPLCGMKAYRMSVYRALGHFDAYGSIGTELALFAAKSGRRITEVMVKTRPRADAPRFGSLLKANARILKACVYGNLPRFSMTSPKS